MVVFDASILLLMLDADSKPPLDPSTRQPVTQTKDRIDYLLEQLSDAGEQVIIPTPALSEVLVYAGDATADYLKIINKEACFKVAPFDQKSAIEAALAVKDSIDRGGMRSDSADPTTIKAKIKFDRQIIAIAKVWGAHTIHSDDEDIMRYGRRSGISVVKISDLPLPPADPQHNLPL